MRRVVVTVGLMAWVGCGAGEEAPAPRDAAREAATPVEATPAPTEEDAPVEVTEAPRLLRAGEPVSFGQDVTEQVRAQQAKLGAPGFEPERRRVPTQRRPRVVRRDAGGFVLRMPDPLPVPTPTVHDGMVIVGAGLWMGGMGAKTGEVRWARGTVDMGPSTVACEGELCAWNTFSCTVTAVEARTGALVSNTILGPTVISAPAIADGVGYVGFAESYGGPGERFQGGVAAIDLRAGEARWGQRVERDTLGAPVVTADGVHVVTWGGGYHRFGRADGTLLRSEARFAAGPPVPRDDGLLFTRLTQREGAWEAQALFDRTATPLEGAVESPTVELLRWPAPRARAAVRRLFPDARPRGEWPPELVVDWPGTQIQGIVDVGPYSHHELIPGHSIVAAGDLDVMVLGDDVVAFDERDVAWSRSLAPVHDDGDVAAYRDRDQRWARYLKMSFEGLPPATLAASPTRVVAVTLAGDALVLDAASGTLLQTLDLGYPVATEPTLADGWLYVGTATGHLVAVDTGDREVDGWSHYRGNARRDGHPSA